MVQNIFSNFWKAYKNQILAALIVNLIGLSHGIGLGWLSPALRIFHSSNSPLDSDITTEQESWIGACISIGGLFGTLIFGLLLDRIGRKWTVLSLAIPNMSFWIIIFFTNQVSLLYLARILAGCAYGGIYTGITIFLAEVCDDKIRGTLGSVVIFVVNFGILLGFILTSYIPYKILPCIVIAIPILHILLTCYLPETPRYLLLSGRETDAKMSMKFYRNFVGVTNEEFKQFNEHFETLKNSLTEESKSTTKVTWRDFCTPPALKAIAIGIFLMMQNQFCGSFAIINYSSKIFQNSGVDLDPDISTIILGAVQIVGFLFATMLVDRIGRKPLLSLSLLLTGFGLLTTGVFSNFRNNERLANYSWIPVFSLSFVIFASAFGITALPFVILVEILPGKIRSITSMGCLIMLCLFAFAVLKVFPTLMEMIGLYGVMYFCGGFCILAVVFVVLFVPETKGKHLVE